VLKRLHIRNYALIDALEIQFSEQLTIITGETGAGKSILLGALGLIMGERADSKIFFNDTEKCVVEGVFEVGKYRLQDFFSENELDYDDEVVVRREVSPAGKSRAFVNDTPVNNGVLQRLTESLLDLHQQFDTLDIHNVNFQLRMIDALADNAALLKVYQKNYRLYTADQKRLADMIAQSDNGAKEMEYQRFLLTELQQAALMENEQAPLEEELTRLSNAVEIKRIYGQAYAFLAEHEPSITGQLKEIGRSMQAMRKLSPRLEEIGERLDSALIELQEVAKDCDRVSESTEDDPQRIAEIQERLNTIYKLQKKHGLDSVGELLALQERLEGQLGGFTGRRSHCGAGAQHRGAGKNPAHRSPCVERTPQKPNRWL
jgi:DNA repair protein RecN (Recombination protein N)